MAGDVFSDTLPPQPSPYVHDQMRSQSYIKGTTVRCSLGGAGEELMRLSNHPGALASRAGRLRYARLEPWWDQKQIGLQDESAT